MIITKIYFGENQIRQIYQNGKVIWNYGEPISIVAGVEISTYAKAIPTLFAIFGLQGKSETSFNATGFYRKFTVLKILGTSPNNTIAISSVISAKAISIDSVALSTSDTDEFLRLFKVVLAKSAVEETTETSSFALIFRSVSMATGIKSNSDTKAAAYAPVLVKLCSIKIPINTDTQAFAHSYILATIEGKAPSDTNALAETLRFFIPLPIESEGNYLTYSKSQAQTIPPHNFSGFSIDNTFANSRIRKFIPEYISSIAESICDTFSNSRALPAIIKGGKLESISNASGKLTLVAEKIEFATASWAKIAEISESGKANEVFAVGDRKLTKINGVDTVVEIIGFNHDDKADGSGKAGITIWVRSLSTCFSSYNDVSSNQKSWIDTMSYTHGISKVTFEDELAAVVKTVNKTYEIANNNYITSYGLIATKAWMISASELGYDLTYNSGAEGTVYEKFSTGKVKTKTYEDIKLSYAYWTRSYPGSKSIFNCMGVTSAGKLTNAGSTTDRRYPSLCFCI